MATKLVHSKGNLVRAKEDIPVQGFHAKVIKAGTVGIIEASMSKARKRVVYFEGDVPKNDITVSVAMGLIDALA